MWNDDSLGVGGAGGDSNLSAVKAQVFAANGNRVGSEILVNTVTTEAQYGEGITALSNGGFVVTWEDYNGVLNEGDGYLGLPRLKAQLFAADGTRVGGEILVSTAGVSTQITTLSNGGFVVTWNDYAGGGGDTSLSAVRAQVFTAGGAPVGSEILVNSATENAQDLPEITALTDGGFVVTWRDLSRGVGGADGDTTGYAVKAQVFAAGGSKVGSEILVNTATADSQHDQQITALSNGGFVVTWNEGSEGEGGAGGDDSDYAVKAQLFTAGGSKVGSEILVNTATAGAQTFPRITVLPDGGFVVTWDDFSQGMLGDTSGYAVKAQVFVINETPVAQAGTGTGNEDADITGQLVATDADAGSSLTYSLVADAAHGSVEVNTDGSYTYTPDANYNGSDSFTYKANDGTDDSNTATVTLTVNAVNDAPVMNLNGAALSYTENGTPAAIAPSATMTDLDSTDFNGGSLTVSTGGNPVDQLTIGNQGTGAGQISVSLGVVSYEGVAIGTFTGGSNGANLVVNFNSAAATQAAVQALLRDILYSSSSDNLSNSTRTVTFTVVDGDGTASGGGDTDTDVAMINVTAVNDAPTIGAFKPTYAITRISTNAAGEQADIDSGTPVFSPDGSKIAFVSWATNLVAGDTNGVYDVFVKDLTTGAVTQISVDAAGVQGNSRSFDPVFSPDGSKILFYSEASNLVAGDTNGVPDIFVKDLVTGAVTRVSVDAGGAQGNDVSREAVFSPDGSKVAFRSEASNLVPGDTNGVDDIFVKDLATGAITRVSVDAGGAQGNAGPYNYGSSAPVFSPDGNKIAFHSACFEPRGRRHQWCRRYLRQGPHHRCDHPRLRRCRRCASR